MADSNATPPSWRAAQAAVVLGLALTVTAAVHRIEYGSPSYTRSPLISIEIGLLALLALVLVAQPIVALVYVAQKRWHGLLVVGVTVATCLGFSSLAIVVDAATLLYAT